MLDPKDQELMVQKTRKKRVRTLGILGGLVAASLAGAIFMFGDILGPKEEGIFPANPRIISSFPYRNRPLT